MATPVVVHAKRTPQGKEGGVFADTRSEDLSIPLIEDALETTGVAPKQVEDLLWGVAQQRGEQDNNVARVIALLSSLGEGTPATTINRWCASSMQALISASDAVAAGNRDCVIAGGVENMSRVSMDNDTYQHLHPELSAEYNVFQLQMGMTAEKVAEEYGVSREAQDEYAARSQQRATEAMESGRFDDEILPIETAAGVVDEDEGIRPDTTAETLAELPPAFTGDGTVTAGNASQISDGASLVMVTSARFAEEHGLDVVAEIGSNDVAGVDPTVMGIGPVPATTGLFERAGTEIEDYDLVELNEAFASQCVYAQERLGVPDDQFNVNGGAIALGHPLGASGARLPVTLLHEMQKRGGGRGLATLCVGFGQGAAIEFVME
jgi:acetyl-CoA acyltransferase